MNRNDNAFSIFEELFKDMIGNNIQFESPIKDPNGNNSKKFILYFDFTASGKGLKRIEGFIENQILPTYANVHSTVGHNAEITTKYLHEAKEKLRKYTNAFGNYSIIFHGQGATGGASKLIDLVGIKKYVSFYNKLKTAFELKQKLGNEIINTLEDGLIKEIKEQFNELFVNINFCIKYKENNRHIIKCILCKVDLINEGDYYKHQKSVEHKDNLQKYENNQIKEFFEIRGHPITDFIDIIKEKYYKAPILNLINDYKKFKPVVFYSLFEHNSNSLSWKETQCETVVINTDYDIIYEALEIQLLQYKDNYIKIGSFTASSNITGLLLDIDRISLLMHKANGFAFFDYAAAAPYLKMDLNGPLPDEYRKLLGFIPLSEEEKRRVYKDGLFFSPHKFIGGPNTPGVLIAHDRIYRNQLKPTQPGGGTVSFVYKNMIDYIHDVEFKEESGTPNIIGSIRLGLMISIRQKIPHDLIIQMDEHYIGRFLKELENIPNLYILHDNILNNKTHIPVFSFMISFNEKFLHPNYISALLNDLFGIQCRPGCSCAPNYGLYLLGFDKDDIVFELLHDKIREGNDIMKPGYLRLNLPYFYPKEVIDYVINAIKFICENGHCFLGMYYYDIKSGRFYHYRNKNKDIELSLDLFDFASNLPRKEDLYSNKNKKELSVIELNKIFQEVEGFTEDKTYLQKTFNFFNNQIISKRHDFQPLDDLDNVRWFCLYQDVKDLLRREYFFKLHNIDDNNEQVKRLKEEIEQKRKKRKKDWDIKFKNENVILF